MSDLQREQAQRRAERIASFRAELAELHREQVLQLSAEQEQGLAAYHEQLLAHYRQALDIDADARARQLSLGMRLASLVGALALAAGLFFLFYQFWGLFDARVQVAVLVGSSLGSLLLCFWLQARDASGYYAKLAAVLASSASCSICRCSGRSSISRPRTRRCCPGVRWRYCWPISAASACCWSRRCCASACSSLPG